MQRIIDFKILLSQKALEEERYDAAAQIRDKAGAGLVSFLMIAVCFLFCSSVMAEFMYLQEIFEDFGFYDNHYVVVHKLYGPIDCEIGLRAYIGVFSSPHKVRRQGLS